jgi:hypothetical protein
MVTVYHFRVWDQQKGESVVPRRKSTAERIRDLGGTIVAGSAEEVDEAKLDLERRYDPKQPEVE